MTRPTTAEVLALVEEISEMLHGKGPTLRGVALADLVAAWAAGHNPDIREMILEQWIGLMRNLIPEAEKAIIARFGDDPWRNKAH